MGEWYIYSVAYREGFAWVTIRKTDHSKIKTFRVRAATIKGNPTILADELIPENKEGTPTPNGSEEKEKETKKENSKGSE